MDGEQAARIPERGENLQKPFVIQPAVIGGVGLERGKSLRHDLGNPGKDVVVHMLEHAVQGIVRVAAAVRLLQIHGELMGQIASLWAEARVFHDGRGAAPCRRQRSGFETVGDVRVAHRQVDVGMGVDPAGHDHAAGYVHDFRPIRLWDFVQPFAEFQNPVVFNQDVRVEDAVRACDQSAGNKHTHGEPVSLLRVYSRAQRRRACSLA